MTKEELQLSWTKSQYNPMSNNEILIDQLLFEIANDSNSSSFREGVTKLQLGLLKSESKHGYDDDFSAIEVKPQNFSGKSKVNGAGNFNDMTWRRHKKYLNEEMILLKSGFYYGKLIFITKFKYEIIAPKIEQRLMKFLPDGDEVGKYDRWGTFTVDDWKLDYKLEYLSPNIEKYQSGMTGKLYNILNERNYNGS